MSSNKGKALKQQKTVAKITLRGARAPRANSSRNVENLSPKAGGSSDGHTTSLRQSSRPRKRKAVFGEDEDSQDTMIGSKPKSVTRVTKVNKPDAPQQDVFEDLTASQVVSILGDPLLTSTQKVHEELRDEHDQDAQPLGTESDVEDPSYNKVNDNSSGSSDTEKYEETRNEENLSDGNNSSGSEDDYVVHSQRKLTKEGDKGRIKAAPTNMNTFNESLLTDKSMSRSQIVLSPEAMQRKIFQMDLKMYSLPEGMKTLLNVRKIACDEPEDDDIVRDSKFKLPLNNMAELERLDKLLKMDRKVVKKLTSELAFCGKEGNFNKTVSNTLKHVIGPDLWPFYTFCGIESKAGETVVRKFKGLDVYQCIENANRNRFPNETVSAIHGKCIEVFTKTRNQQMKKAANK